MKKDTKQLIIAGTIIIFLLVCLKLPDIFQELAIIGLGLTGLGLSISYLIKAIKNEKKAKSFRTQIRKGDRVTFHVMESKMPEGEVIDTDPLGDGEYVKVSTIVPKRFIYP